MASPKISVRLDSDTYNNLLRMAQIERKTITELVRELIDRGLTATSQPEAKEDDAGILQRLDVIEMHIGDLLMKTVKASASAQFMARLAVAFGSDTVSWLTEQRLADKSSKGQFLSSIDEQAEQHAQEYLMRPE